MEAIVLDLWPKFPQLYCKKDVDIFPINLKTCFHSRCLMRKAKGVIYAEINERMKRLLQYLKHYAD